MVDVYLPRSNPDYLALPTPICHHHDHSEMRDAARRRASFINWPVGFISPEELADAGFFYLKHEDAVECAYCSVQVGRWERGDVALEEHKKWSPRCPFLRRQRSQDYETDSVGVSAVEDYSSYTARVKSFKDWPTALEQTPEELAKAGFYYTGTSDKVICYACNEGMFAWEKGDVPLKEHAKVSPNCEHLIREVGLKYIQEVNKEIEEDVMRKSADSGFCESLEEETGKPSVDPEISCKICYDRPRTVLLLPCQHLSACVECSVKLDKCPICRKPFESVIKTILE